MSREGVMLAARERARRTQAALGGEATPVLMGYAFVVLVEAPRASMPAEPRAAANESLGVAPVTGHAGAPAGTRRGR